MLKKKRIVIIRSNPVNPDSRVEKEAFTLANCGYEVRILCWDRESNHKELNTFLNINGVNVPITRMGFKSTYGEGFKNIIPYLKFQRSIKRWLKKNVDYYDAIHACDFDTAFSSYRFALKKKKKFIFDIFDFLYGEPKTLLQRVVKKKQLRIINVSDLTIICTEQRKNQISGSNPKRLIVVHNSPAKEQILLDNVQKKRENNKPRVCYVGILQDGRLLREIGEYFGKHDDVELHIGGFGYLDTYFSGLSNNHSNIKYYGRLQYSSTLELEHNCDILLAIYDPSVENHRYAAPNKFYESLFLGKPVIMVRGTGMSDVVASNRIGTLIDFSYNGFCLGMTNILNDKGNWENISNKEKELYDNHYSWEIMSKRLISAYSDLFKEI